MWIAKSVVAMLLATSLYVLLPLPTSRSLSTTVHAQPGPCPISDLLMVPHDLCQVLLRLDRVFLCGSISLCTLISDVYFYSVGSQKRPWYFKQLLSQLVLLLEYPPHILLPEKDWPILTIGGSSIIAPGALFCVAFLADTLGLGWVNFFFIYI